MFFPANPLFCFEAVAFQCLLPLVNILWSADLQNGTRVKMNKSNDSAGVPLYLRLICVSSRRFLFVFCEHAFHDKPATMRSS